MGNLASLKASTAMRTVLSDPISGPRCIRFSDFAERADEDDFLYLSTRLNAESSGKLKLERDSDPAKGRFVTANVPLSAGDVILVTPAVQFRQPSNFGMALLLPQILERLPELHRLVGVEPSALETNEGLLKYIFSVDYPARALRIVWNNCFETVLDDGGTRGIVLSLTGSMFQHSCKFNVVTFYQADGTQAFVCTRDVCEGDQLFVSYNTDCSKMARWHFRCPETSHEDNYKRSTRDFVKTVHDKCTLLKIDRTCNVTMPLIDSIGGFKDALNAVLPGIARSKAKEFEALFGSNVVPATERITVSSCSACGSVGTARAGLQICSRCKASAYCSTACQAAHWRHHKNTCGSIVWSALARALNDPHTAIAYSTCWE